MKHRIGNSHNASGFNIVTDKKLVKEEEFYKQLEESVKELVTENSDEALNTAKEYLSKGRSVTIEGKYYEIKKR